MHTNTITDVPAPGANFNFAQHLLDNNTQRLDKAAFIDDLGSLSYGELDQRVRQIGRASCREIVFISVVAV